MQTIDAELRREWGNFAFLGLASVDELAREAGDSVFIVGSPENSRLTPIGCLQTITTNLGGDPQSAYPTFEALTSKESWRHLRGKAGDTIVLLQITIFKSDERGGGIGSLLRNALLKDQALRAVHRLEFIWSVRPRLLGAAKHLPVLRRLHVPIALRPKGSWRPRLRRGHTTQS